MSKSSTTLSLLRMPRFLGVLASASALGMSASFVLPFLSLWGTTKVGFTPVQFGGFMTVVTLSAIVMSISLGHWSDRNSSRRTMLIIGGSAGALGYLGYATITNPWLLTLNGVAMLGVASICFSQLFAHVREVYAHIGSSGRSRPSTQAMSLTRVCFSLSWTVGPALAATMLAHSSFSGLFLCASGLFALFVATVTFSISPEPPPQWTSGKAPVSIRQALRQPDLLLSFMAMACTFAAHSQNMLNLPLYFTDLLGGTTHDLGITFGIGPIVELPLMLWFGRAATKLGRYRLMQFGILATSLYFASLFLATKPWHVFCAQSLSGVSFAILTNVAITFFQDLRPGQAGLATSVFSTALNTGNLVGYLVFGIALKLGGYRGIPAEGVFLTLAAFVLFYFVHRYTEMADHAENAT